MDITCRVYRSSLRNDGVHVSGYKVAKYRLQVRVVHHVDELLEVQVPWVVPVGQFHDLVNDVVGEVMVVFSGFDDVFELAVVDAAIVVSVVLQTGEMLL